MNKNVWPRLLLLLVVLSYGSIKAQSTAPYYLKYFWEQEPKITTLNETELKESELIQKDNRIFEYTYEKNGDLIVYITRHKKVKLNNDKGVEHNNKIYISMRNVIELMDVKVRSISKDGRVTNIDKKSIKDVDDLEGSGPFKIIAVEGVEVGSEVEYLYTIKRNSYYFGTEVLQGQNIRKDVDVVLISPPNLVYEGKLYNSKLKMEKDTTIEDQNKLAVHFDKIDGIKDEKYAAYDAGLIRLEFKLAYNAGKGKTRLLTWDDAAARYYEIAHDLGKKDLSAVHSMLKKLKIESLSEEEKIYKIENFIKSNFKIQENGDPSSDLVENIIDKKYGSTNGLIKLYTACFIDMNVAAELVITNDRMNVLFDGDFDTWNFLDDYLFYFPAIDKYTSPKNLLSRVGFPTPGNTGLKGLFVKEVQVGDLKSGIAKIKTIKNTNAEFSSHTTMCKVKFAEDFASTNVELKQEYRGYAAYYTQPYYHYMNDNQKLEIQEAYLKVCGEDAKMSDIKVSNYNEEDILKKPFIMECNLNSPSLIEKAGNKYIFKVGTLIGAQAELYQESERKLDAEIEYTHSFIREISVEIPEGYKVSNLEKLNFDVQYKDGDDVKAEFKSAWKLEGSTLKISGVERYLALNYPLARFEDFRKVINAAADFNKVTILFEKK